MQRPTAHQTHRDEIFELRSAGHALTVRRVSPLREFCHLIMALPTSNRVFELTHALPERSTNPGKSFRAEEEEEEEDHDQQNEEFRHPNKALASTKATRENTSKP
jgi:hypothetical protein